MKERAVVIGGNGEADEEAVGEAHGLDHRGVLALVHEAPERGEPADDEQLDVARAAV